MRSFTIATEQVYLAVPNPDDREWLAGVQRRHYAARMWMPWSGRDFAATADVHLCDESRIKALRVRLHIRLDAG